MVELSRPMKNEFVRLEALTGDHKEHLRGTDIESFLWSFMPFRGDATGFDSYFNAIIKESAAGVIVPFAVMSIGTQRLAGVTAFTNISRQHRRLGIGYTWYEPCFRRTSINPSAKLLMLQRAFDWGALRVEFLTDSRNEASRQAILKLGAKPEGCMRSHTRFNDGTRGDTELFSILKDEWDDVRTSLVERLNNLASE